MRARASGRSTGPRHAGITVSDLDRSLDFYCGMLGLELLPRRLYEEREIAEIVDVPEATAWDIAFLRLPGSDVEIELLEYKGCERRSGSGRPCDYGHRALRAVRGRHRRAVRRPLGPRRRRSARTGRSSMVRARTRGGKSLYAHDPDGYVIEFSQRPPRMSTVTDGPRGSRSTGRWR